MKLLLVFTSLVLGGCMAKSQKGDLFLKEKLPGKLKEISGISWRDKSIWAISDKSDPFVFKLSEEGKVEQEIELREAKLNDVEAITSDNDFLYIGDVGDNDGDRIERTIVKVPIGGISKGENASVKGENITFTFGEETIVDKKKNNDFDCEALLALSDSIYLFTKRRSDEECALYVIPNAPGTYTARFISKYNTRGMITDAAINPSNNEVALTGYKQGHEEPFMLFFSNFKGNDFFSGNPQRIDLSDKKEVWQIEGITYKSNDVVYFSCEETKEVKATLYAAGRKNIQQSVAK